MLLLVTHTLPPTIAWQRLFISGTFLNGSPVGQKEIKIDEGDIEDKKDWTWYWYVSKVCSGCFMNLMLIIVIMIWWRESWIVNFEMLTLAWVWWWGWRRISLMWGNLLGATARASYNSTSPPSVVPPHPQHTFQPPHWSSRSGDPIAGPWLVQTVSIFPPKLVWPLKYHSALPTNLPKTDYNQRRPLVLTLGFLQHSPRISFPPRLGFLPACLQYFSNRLP